jgi:hypothetical protein
MAKHDMSISSLWKHLEFVCGETTEKPCHTQLDLIMQGKQPVYQCPVCGHTTSYYDVERFINKITKMIIEDTEDGVETNLTNFQTKIVSRYDGKQHIFRVLSHTPTELKVSLRNG